MTFLDRRPSSRLLLLLFAACVWMLAAAGAGAGEPVEKKQPAEEFEENFDVYLDEDEDADRLLRLAARYAESRKWKLCLEKYLECMRLYGGRLTRAGSRDRELYLSVSVAVRREMASVPKEGRELWRLLKLGRFRSRVRVACARGSDPEELAGIARDFAGLKFAARALLYLGEARYARGDAAGAVAAWRRLLREYPDGDYPRIKVLGRAGLAAAEAGLSTEARAILARLRKESALAEVNAGGKPLRLVDEIEKRLAAAERRTGIAVSGSGPAAWSVLGGDATHNRPARSLVRPTVLRWRRQLPVPAGWAGNPQLRYLRRYGTQIKKSKAWPFPAYHPAAAGELVFVSGDMGITALRAHDGELAWSAPKGEKGVAVGCGLVGPALTGGALVARQGRLVMGSGYGYRNVSSSSGLLLLEALTGKKLGEKERIQSPLEIPKDEDQEEGEPAADAVRAQLMRAGQAGQAGKRTQFTSVPVLAEGRIYCGLIRSSTQPEYELASFDPKSGKLLWRVFLCGAAPVRGAMPSNMGWGGRQGAPLSEIGQPLAVAGRTIYVVTNLGAVAAADADDGRLKWLRLYPRYSPSDGKVVDRRNVRMGRSSYQSPDRGTANMWEPCAPVLTGGLLIAAPQDCDYLLAIDAETGRLVWRAPRVGLRRLLGAVDGKVVLSGADQVVVRDAADGRALWRRRLGGRVVGHGAMGKDYVALSTTKALEVLNLSGKPIFQYKWKEPKTEAGNVLVHGENVYTVSATHINAYCDLDEITRRLVAEAGKKPRAALPRFLTGALELAGGRREQAIATLEAALERVKPAERYAGASLAKAIRGKLWQCHWQGARKAIGKKKHEAALRHLDFALKCAPDAEHAPRTLLARAGCLEKLARLTETLETYQKLLAEYPEAPCERPDGSRLRTWLLAKGEIARLLEKSGPEAYAKYEERAAELLAEARESGKGELAQKLVALYPNSKSAGQALLLAAELAAKAGRYDVELRCLRRHIFLRGGGPKVGEARARLALAYARRGYLGAARQIARQLAATGGKLTIDGKDLDPAELAPPPRPAATPPLVEKWRVKLKGASLVPGCAGDSQLVLIGAGRITAVDAESGKMLWKFEPDKAGLGALNPYQYPGREQMRIDGDAVIISIGRQRAALDRTTGKLRWKTEVRTDQTRRYYGGQYTGKGRGGSSAADGVLACRESVSKVDQLGNGEQRKLIRALSVDDGKELWTLLVSKQENTGRSRYYGRGAGGLGRTADGRLAAWGHTPQTHRPKRTKQKTSFMIIDATTGKVTRRFEAKDVSPVGLFRDRLICRSQQQKMVAFNLDGKKAWIGTGRWNLLASSDRQGKLIVSIQVRSGGVYRQDIAAIDARGGKLLWKHSSGKTSRYSRSYYGGQRLADILPDRLIMTENLGYTYYNPYAQRRANLKVWDMKSGKILWKSPFVPAGHTRAAGRKHLACAFMKVEQLDKDGKVIVRRRPNRWGRVVGVGQQQVEVKAMRVSTVVRVFDIDGGKALWEWVETKRIEGKGNQPVWTWYQGRSGGRVSATARGLLISTPDSVLLLAPAKSPESDPEPDVKPDK